MGQIPLDHATSTDLPQIVADRRQNPRDDVASVSSTQASTANRSPSSKHSRTTSSSPRSANRRVAFGYGAHVCLGQHLAKVEIRALFRELLQRLDHIELAGEPA